MGSMEEDAHALRRAQAQRRLDQEALRRNKAAAVRQRLDPLIHEFAATARRIGLPRTPDPSPGKYHLRPPDGYQRGEWVLDLTYWPEQEDYRRSVTVDVWPDGRWTWRHEPSESYLDYMLEDRHLWQMRDSMVAVLSTAT
jgi:hypothetical protein